jgi:hypothetical protein
MMRYELNTHRRGSGSDTSWAPGRQCYQTIKDVRVWTKK